MSHPTKIAIITSQFNPEVTLGLREGALTALAENGVAASSVTLLSAPGAFEIPLIAKKAALSGAFRGVIGLGCVIKGDTAHFEFISLGAAMGLQQAMLETGVPMAFGILTTYTDAQAVQRAQPGPENKGREAALAVIHTLNTLAQLGDAP